jgi:predicted ester cyclase
MKVIEKQERPAEVNKAETVKVSNIDLAKRFNEYLDEQNFDGLRAISDPDLKIYYESGYPASLNDLEPFIKSYYQSFPDYTHEIEDIFAADDKAVARIAFSGTHTNEFSGIKPTGIKFRYKGIQIYQFKDNKINNLWIVEDELGMMTQLGMELRPKEEMDEVV